MPATATRRTPGVYVTELTSFPPSVVGVQTAVPAFIGYTEYAEISGKPVYNKPIKIGSLADYEEVFGGEFDPVYGLEPVTDEDEIDAGYYDFRVLDPTVDPAAYKYYNLVQQSDSRFNLYNSMRFFYDNGGGNCYVVSVGPYVKPDGTKNTVSKDALSEGLDVIKEEVGPTMLVVPEAVLLPSDKDSYWQSADFQAIVRQMLEQCQELQDRVAILDVYGTQYLGRPAPEGETAPTLDTLIEKFREDVGDKGLSYGMAYYPFLDTTVVPLTDVDYTNIDSAGDNPYDTLKQILQWERQNLYGETSDDADCEDPGTLTTNADKVSCDIEAIGSSDDSAFIQKLNQNLLAALPLLKDMERVVVAKNDVLPPSGGMAGVFTYVDGTRGVWNAPANVTLSSVAAPTFLLNRDQQADLNVPINGKAVDALREFTGRGTVVWGARTLDGNSNDYRYIQVRRTLIYIEQSIKNALNQFVFAANDGNTWATVVAMVSSFLQTVWSQGGLMGASSSDAYSVECGLGSTMTPTDILEGYMIVQVTLQMIRPAEFIELTFKQKMEG